MVAAVKIDSYQRLQYDISHAHDMLKLGLDNILIHLQKPPLDDLPNFLGYCSTWAKLLDGHHDSEELVLFPFLNQKLDMSAEVEQHKAIHTFLAKLVAFITAAQADPAMFDAVKMTAIINSLRDPLFQHLDEEIAHLAPENLKVFDAKELDDATNQLIKYAISHDNPFLSFPFALRHIPPEVKATWPEIPGFLKKIVTPYILHWRYRGYWKYCPYDYSY